MKTKGYQGESKQLGHLVGPACSALPGAGETKTHFHISVQSLLSFLQERKGEGTFLAFKETQKEM